MALLALVLTIAMVPGTVLAAGNTAEAGTREEFLAAVADGGVTNIHITTDIDLTGAGLLDVSGKTIDLGGNEIYADNDPFYDNLPAYHIRALTFGGENFTLKNGKISSGGNRYALYIYGWDDPVIKTTNVTIQDIEVNGGVDVYDSSNVILQNVTSIGSYLYAIWVDFNSEVIVEGGTFKADNAALIGMATNTFPSTLSVRGGTFKTNGKPLVLDADNRGKPVISGGIYDCSAKKYVADGFEFECNNNGDFTYHKTIEDALNVAGTDAVISAVDSQLPIENARKATLDYNDGSGRTVQIVADADGNITLPSIEQNGYIFEGWDDGTGHLIAGGQVYNLTEDKTLTGQWKVITKVKVDAKEPTCTKEGNIEYWYCPELDSYYRDEALTQKISREDTVIPATGTHSYQDGKCTVCGQPDPNYKTETTASPVQKPAKAPQTGDNANLALWIAVIILTSMTAAGMTAYMKKKRSL